MSKKLEPRFLANMTKAHAQKLLMEINEQHAAADEGNTEVAKAYKNVKKLGINLDAFRTIRKLKGMDHPAKVQAWLADFDKMRELYDLDAQTNLFEEDKTAPQKAAEAADAAAREEGTQEPVAEADAPVAAEKPKRGGRKAKVELTPDLSNHAESWGKAAESVPASEPIPATLSAAETRVAKMPIARAALFAESDEDEQQEASPKEAARQRGYAAGVDGDEYRNPYPRAQAELHGAYHEGWIKGADGSPAGAIH